jgi:hypothetical protein
MLGTAGDRDPVCIGNATIRAENVQLAMAGNHLGITSEIYNAIGDEGITSHFTWNKEEECYEGTALTWTAIEDAEDEEEYQSAKTAGYTSAGTIVVGTRATAMTVPLKVTRPYAE